MPTDQTAPQQGFRTTNCYGLSQEFSMAYFERIIVSVQRIVMVYPLHPDYLNLLCPCFRTTNCYGLSCAFATYSSALCRFRTTNCYGLSGCRNNI